MTRLLGYLLIAASTFCLGAGVDSLVRAGLKNSLSGDRLYAGISADLSPTSFTTLATPTTNNSRISQEAIVRFPKIGDVRVCANEDFGKELRLTFTDQRSGKELLSNYYGSSNWNWSDDASTVDWNPKLRFKTISVKGLPSPLVIAIAMNPGASDSAWEAGAVGVVDGQLQILTYETMATSNDGGFFFGDLGDGVGPGAAQWDYVWGEGESHPPPHKYEVKLFKWNGRRFEWYKVFRTRRQYNSANAALNAYGLGLKDVRSTFPEWTDLGW